VSRVCALVCASGLTNCSGACVNVSADTNNCGACGNVCPSGLSCIRGGCSTARFNGLVGSTWTPRAGNPPSGEYPGYTDYTPAGSDFIYTAQNTALFRYSISSDAWTGNIASIPVNVGDWASAAWVGTDLYVIRGGAVLRFNTATTTWTTMATGVASTEYSMTTHDESGHVFGVTTDSRVVRYTIATNVVDYIAITGAPSVYEPRISYDAGTRLLYIAPRYDDGVFVSVDPVTGVTSTLPSHPRRHMNDVYCGDRSGSVYAAGASSGTEMWQYNIATRIWARIADLPFDHGNNGGCTITDSGFLYMTSGSGNQTARIQLLP